MELVIGCVGKPSAGKSTFFNAVTDGKAKTGNYPFTTIEPNTGITFFRCECACKSRGKMDVCAPRYGRCVKGERQIPVKLLDVAGLIPGASKGAGLGNKFLNDLTGAHVLMHIVDVSGTTNEKGQATEGYDPINDIDWLQSEITDWIFGNLWEKWGSTVRRHVAAKATAAQTFTRSLSGYGAKPAMIMDLVSKLGLREPCDLASWKEEEVKRLAVEFVELRFPTIYVLNKADLGSETDKNIAKITDKYDSDRCIVTSAASECYLKKMRKQGYIRYPIGASFYTSLEDMTPAELEHEEELKRLAAEHDARLAGEDGSGGGKTEEAGGTDAPKKDKKKKKDKKSKKSKKDKEKKRKRRGRRDHENLPLIPLDEAVRDKLDKIADMVIFRWGGTGVWDAIQTACELRKPVVAYPVRSVTNYSTTQTGEGVFATALLLRPGTTVREMAFAVSHDIGRGFLYAEGEDGRRMGEDEVVTETNNVIKFAFTPPTTRPAAKGASGSKGGDDKRGGAGSGAGAGAGAGADDDEGHDDAGAGAGRTKPKKKGSK